MAGARISLVLSLCSAFSGVDVDRGHQRRSWELFGSDDGSEESSPPNVFDWLKDRRDVFEPKFPWLTERRAWSDIVQAGRRAEKLRIERGRVALKREIAKLVRRDQVAREELQQFLDEEWARENEARAEAQQLLDEVPQAAQAFLENE